MKVEAHQQYSHGDYPGVTTVLNVLDKPGMPKWANNLGLRGIDSTRYTTERGEVGTLAHEMIMHYFRGTNCDTGDYSANQIQEALDSLRLFHQWRETYKVEPVLVETQLVSHRFGYGGTIDLLAKLTIGNQEFLEVCDFKTGSGPWPSHYAQLAAYFQLVFENGHRPDNCRLVKIGIDPERDTFSEFQLLKLDKYWKLFLHCLAIYRMKVL